MRDIEIINTELCLADMETVEKRQERLVKLAKTGDKKVKLEQAVMEKVMAGLTEAVPARRLGLNEEEQEFLGEMHLLTMKPVLYVTNVAESEVADPSGNKHVQAVEKYLCWKKVQKLLLFLLKWKVKLLSRLMTKAGRIFGNGRSGRNWSWIV